MFWAEKRDFQFKCDESFHTDYCCVQYEISCDFCFAYWVLVSGTLYVPGTSLYVWPSLEQHVMNSVSSISDYHTAVGVRSEQCGIVYKAVKIAWRDWGVALITWKKQGGFPQ